MSAFYGARFADAWKGCNVAEVKAAWAEELGDYSPEEIATGVAALRTRDWPPTLPEFLKLCRPPIDPDAGFAEAAREYLKRFDKGDDQWSRPEVFWAAQAIGYQDLRNLPYERLKGRWKAALEKAGREPVPVKLVALPAAGEVRANPAHVKAVMDGLRRKMAMKAAKVESQPPLTVDAPEWKEGLRHADPA